jgi:hypothetical protein
MIYETVIQTVSLMVVMVTAKMAKPSFHAIIAVLPKWQQDGEIVENLCHFSISGQVLVDWWARQLKKCRNDCFVCPLSNLQ